MPKLTIFFSFFILLTTQKRTFCFLTNLLMANKTSQRPNPFLIIVYTCMYIKWSRQIYKLTFKYDWKKIVINKINEMAILRDKCKNYLKKLLSLQFGVHDIHIEITHNCFIKMQKINLGVFNLKFWISNVMNVQYTHNQIMYYKFNFILSVFPLLVHCTSIAWMHKMKTLFNP